MTRTIKTNSQNQWRKYKINKEEKVEDPYDSMKTSNRQSIILTTKRKMYLKLNKN